MFISALDGTIHALGLDDGQSRWFYKHPSELARESELELYGSPAPVATGDLILAGFHDGSLVALSRDTGEVTWKVGVGEGRYPDLIGAPLAGQQDVYAGGFSAPFQAIDVATQNVRWSLDFGIASAAVLQDRTLFVPGSDGKLRCVDSVTGAIVWEWDSDTSGALTQPQITPAGLLVASSDGGLWLVDEATGLATWTYDDGMMINGISVAPVVDGRQIAMITNAGNIVALMVPSEPQGSDTHQEPPWTAPFASGD